MATLPVLLPGEDRRAWWVVVHRVSTEAGHNCSNSTYAWEQRGLCVYSDTVCSKVRIRTRFLVTYWFWILSIVGTDVNICAILHTQTHSCTYITNLLEGRKREKLLPNSRISVSLKVTSFFPAPNPTSSFPTRSFCNVACTCTLYDKIRWLTLIMLTTLKQNSVLNCCSVFCLEWGHLSTSGQCGILVCSLLWKDFLTGVQRLTQGQMKIKTPRPNWKPQRQFQGFRTSWFSSVISLCLAGGPVWASTFPVEMY